MGNTISFEKRIKIMGLLRKRINQEQIIWEKKNTALTLLDEIDELEQKKLDYGDIAIQCDVPKSTVFYLFKRNKRAIRPVIARRT